MIYLKIVTKKLDKQRIKMKKYKKKSETKRQHFKNIT